MMKTKRIALILLTLALIVSSAVPAFAAEGFAYRHDPRDNPKAMRDIVADENTVYGFRPNDTGSLKAYADADWSDPDLVAQWRTERIAYHRSIESMYALLEDMKSQGKSTEEIARAVSAMRNELRLAACSTEEELETLKARNLEKYGHEEGPLPDELYEQYGSWERVMEKAFSANEGMDACLGLYDDYYFLYASLGDVPADVSIEIPSELICRVGKTAALEYVIAADIPNFTVTFESDDPSTALIDENGVVTGVKRGQTTVRCVVTDPGGNRSESEPCSVRVRCAAEDVLLSFFEQVRAYFERLTAFFR